MIAITFVCFFFFGFLLVFEFYFSFTLLFTHYFSFFFLSKFIVPVGKKEEKNYKNKRKRNEERKIRRKKNRKKKGGPKNRFRVHEFGCFLFFCLIAWNMMLQSSALPSLDNEVHNAVHLTVVLSDARKNIYCFLKICSFIFSCSLFIF